MDSRGFVLRAAEFWRRHAWTVRIVVVLCLAIGWQAAHAQSYQINAAICPTGLTGSGSCPPLAGDNEWMTAATIGAPQASQVIACSTSAAALLDRTVSYAAAISYSFGGAQPARFEATGVYGAGCYIQHAAGDWLVARVETLEEPPPGEPQLASSELALVVGAALVFALGVIVTR